jgi:hypothetical protein
MRRLPKLSPAQAFDIASQWGQLVTNADASRLCAVPYTLRFGDATPISPAHRVRCIAFATWKIGRVRHALANVPGAHGWTRDDVRELRALRRFWRFSTPKES